MEILRISTDEWNVQILGTHPIKNVSYGLLVNRDDSRSYIYVKAQSWALYL